MQRVKINIRKVRLYTMEKKLGARLQEVKKDLERIINKEAGDSTEIFTDKIHVQSILEDWITDDIENRTIRDTAIEVYLELAQMDLYRQDRKYFPKKIFITSLKKFLQVINEELPKEERLDNLEEKLSRAEISFSNYDYHSEENIQEMIHSNARAIARLLVTSNK